MVRIIDETKNNNDVIFSRQHHQASNERTPLVVKSRSTFITSKTSTDDDDEEEPSSPLRRLSFLGEATAAAEQQQQQQNSSNNNAAVLLNHARRLIYVSHTFSQASEVAWQFGLILFLAAFTHYESMILVSTYGMLSYMAVCLFGATAGRFVDGSNRLYAAQWFIWTENASVLMATILCYILLLKLRNENNNLQEEDEDDDNNIMSSYWLYGVPTDRTSILLLLGIHFWGPLAMILDKGFLVAMERDWIVVMSRQAKGTTSSSSSASSSSREQHQQTSATSNDNDNDIGDDENDKRDDAAAQAEWLSTTNVAMKQIDLTCKVIAPAVVGFVIAAFDTTTETDSSSSNSQNNAASTDLTGAVLLVGAVNVAALVVEYVCTARVYHLIPALAVKEDPSAESSHHHRQLSRDSSILVETDWSSTVSERSLSPFKAAAPELFASEQQQQQQQQQQQLSTNGGNQHDQDDEEAATRSEQPLPLHRSKPNPNVAVAAAATTAGNEHDAVTDCGMGREIRRCCCGRRRSSRQLHFTFHRFRRRLLPDGLRIYLKQPISWGGMGLALLYLNCLTFGALMTAYLVWRGMRFETVGIWRGISSALGLSGTVAYHSSVQKTTLVNTGMWSIILEFFCLSLCFASFFVHDFDISVAMLIAGVCFSRIGLWVFDITITQLQQEFIPFGIRGVVGGTQQSLNAFFQLGSFALGLIFPDPRDFWIYALAGWVAIGLAVLFYAVGVFVRAPQFWTTAEKATAKGLAPSTL